MSSTVHLEILPQTQQTVLELLGGIVDSDGFYLAGGTAVALQLGHRRSIDLDWFTGEAFGDPHQYAAQLREHGVPWTTGKTADGTLHGDIDGVKVSFLFFRYSLLDEPVDIAGYNCTMASLVDLSCMKLAAVAQRGSKKDFIDIWALCRHGMELEEMLEAYRDKFSTEDVGHLLIALSYFDDADPEPMPKMLVDVGWDEIKTDIRRRIKDYAGS